MTGGENHEKQRDPQRSRGRLRSSERHTRQLFVFIGFVLTASNIFYGGIELPSLENCFTNLTRDSSPVVAYKRVAFIADQEIDASLFARQEREHNNTSGANIRKLGYLERYVQPDFGGLEFGSLFLVNVDDFQRKIKENDLIIAEKQRRELEAIWEKNDSKKLSKYDAWEDGDFREDRCERPKWTYESHPACNNFHDLSYDRETGSEGQSYDIDFLGNGYFRDAFLFSPLYGGTDFVVKTYRYEHDVDVTSFHLVKTEALVMDVLTASPRTANIYGYCGTSVIVEKGSEIRRKVMHRIKGQRYRGFMENHKLDKLQKDFVYPLNNLTATEKLDLAIAMAEGLAEQHGYYKGVMFNDDVELKQWLVGEDGRVMLNDFSNTEFSSWHRNSSQYCKSYVKYGGDFKSPEEFKGDYVSEKSDIWPMGNIIFTLLTGLHPYHHILTADEDVQAETFKHTPIIDPRYMERSFIEKRMVQIMERCHKYNPEERPSIFKVVELLRSTKAEYQRQQEQQNQQQQE